MEKGRNPGSNPGGSNYICELPIFILRDHEGIPRKVKKYILNNKNITPISVGPQMDFASHVVVILNNIMDRNEV